jgi:hypothetical protein
MGLDADKLREFARRLLLMKDTVIVIMSKVVYTIELGPLAPEL